MRVFVVAGALLLLLLLALASVAHAECDAAAIVARANTVVGRAVFGAGGIALEVRGTTATVRIGDRTRTVSARTCDELVAALAVIGALVPEVPPPAIDPAPVPATAPEPAPLDAPPLPPAPPLAIERAFVVLDPAVLTASAGLAIGSAGQGRVELGVRRDRGARSFGVEVRLAPAFAAFGSSIEVTEASVAAIPCVHRGGWAACAVASAGAVRGASEVRARWGPVLAVGGRVGYERAIAGVRAFVEVELAAPVVRTRYAVDDMPSWTSPRLEASGGIGVRTSIP